MIHESVCAPTMSQLSARAANVCAVLVTYFPEPDWVRNLEALGAQVAEILVVDNGSPPSALEPIARLSPELRVTVLRNGENLGIAAALNAGVQFARERGYAWLATFDQDSLASPALIREMFAALSHYPEPARVAVITPVHVARNVGVSYALRYSLADGECWRLLPSAMTSGNLVNVAAATSVGGFDGTLFIDYVDHEFCLRLRRQGYRILEASKAVLLHSVGQTEVRRFLWKRPTISHHSATRRYYITRNRILLWRQYWNFDLPWTLKDVRNSLYELIYIALWERQAVAKYRAIARGLLDAVRARRGKMSA